MSYKAGGVGLDFTAASAVAFVELPHQVRYTSVTPTVTQRRHNSATIVTRGRRAGSVSPLPAPSPSSCWPRQVRLSDTTEDWRRVCGAVGGPRTLEVTDFTLDTLDTAG